MKFNTIYSLRKPISIDPGSPIKIEYQLRVVDNQMQLVETGKSFLYGYIQSHADSVDIHKILERCALLDDYSLLNRMPAQFMDVTEMPTNLAEAYAQVKDAENFFDRMPTDIKEKYNNNFIEFIADIGSEKFSKNVSEFLNSIKKVDEVTNITEEVKNES